VVASHADHELDQQGEQRLVWLMFGRLVLSVVSFGLAVGLDGLGRGLTEEARVGMYWTVTLAFFATVISGTAFGRVRRPRRFASVQIAIDVAIVTALVHFSGGRESVFTFLYVLVILYGALLFKREVAIGAATLSALAYGGALVTANLGWLLGEMEPGSQLGFPLLTAIWAIHVGGLFLVGALASVLAGELQRTGDALTRSTIDLEKLRELHQQTVESIMSGLLTTDTSWNVTSFNPEAERITGRDADEVLGRDLEEVIPGAREVIEEEQRKSTGGGPRARVALLRQDQRERFVGLAGSILRDLEGGVVGQVVIFQDVTEVVAMEAELRRSERLAAVGELSAKIAHEIRNPLAAISGSVQVLHADLEGKLRREPSRLMDIVVREADRLSDLITDFLHYARPESRQVSRVDLEVLVEDVTKLYESVRNPAVEVHFELEAGLAVMGDAAQLRQVLWNLWINGAQAMPEGGRLSLRVARVRGEPPQAPGASLRNEAEGARSRSGDRGASDAPSELVAARWVEIAVSDAGPGIPREVQERMFEPFFTTKHEGTGLGLATVHRIVESHGGMLQVESEAGRGTVFKILLPECEGPA
jgi:two-component system sensor histidine kinase PilS (NtrC family)